MHHTVFVTTAKQEGILILQTVGISAFVIKPDARGLRDREREKGSIAAL